MTPLLRSLNVFIDEQARRIQQQLKQPYQTFARSVPTSPPAPAGRTRKNVRAVALKPQESRIVAWCGCGRAMARRSRRCMTCYAANRWLGQKRVRHAA